jgi:nucleoside-diphosphate-sugar epimerase
LFFKKPRVLITGGAGFIGRHLARRLVIEGFEVRILVRPTSNIESLNGYPVELAFGDLRDQISLVNATEGVDLVYHLGAVIYPVSVSNQLYWDVNVKGTENLIKACLATNVNRIIHCSTVGVLGSIKNPPADESYPYDPLDIYEKTKTEGEKIALRFARDVELPLVIVRPTSVYGPGNTRLLPLFKLIAKQNFIMLGKGETLIHPVYIDDLIEGLYLCAEKQEIVGQIYIIGGAEYTSLNRFVTAIARVLEVENPRNHIPILPVKMIGSLCEAIFKPLRIEPPIHRRMINIFTKNRAYDISKAKNDLGYSPTVDLDTGILRTIEWYRIEGYI